MIKAVVSKGVIVPLNPLPADCKEGTEVEVDITPCAPDTDDRLDQWFAELQAEAAKGDPEQDRQLEEALREIRRKERELARKQAERPE